MSASSTAPPKPPSFVANDSESCGSDGDDPEEEHEPSVQDKGEVITIPFLKNRYDWGKFVTTTSAPDISVTPDYMPPGGLIEDSYVVARCKYLKMELTSENKVTVRDEIETHLHDMKGKLKTWIQNYWVELSKHVGLQFGEGCDVTTFMELQAAVRQCKCMEVAKKIVTILYLSFDFCGNYRRIIARCLMQQFGLILDEDNRVLTEVSSCGKRKPRKKKNCFEKLVTQMLTEQRKNINNNAFKTCGVTFTYQRAGELINKDNLKNFRKKKRFYSWMVMGDFVSVCFALFDC
jgi:hypothetical protein